MAASFSQNLFGKAPIVVVLGATGTGKSKLAVELALKFKGEVISADSMQVYKGLDIVTNKVTEQEQMGVRHHLLGFLEPHETLRAPEFRNMALDVIRDILRRNKLPIIVGGTNYYIESVLYNVLVDRPDNIGSVKDDEPDVDISSPKRRKLGSFDEDEQKFMSSIKDLSNEELHQKLKEIDPEMADILHPNNRRKIIRCLQVHDQFGVTLTEILKKQRSVSGGCNLGGPLRFNNSLVLWLQCDAEVLKNRLDLRVDSMVSQGLVNELVEFKSKYNTTEVSNYEKGILQTIGFKEFKAFLSLDEESKESEEGKKLLAEGIDLLKIATRQYAKRQIRWIQNRMLRNIRREVPPIYGLDATDVTKWKEYVYDKAENLVDCFLSGVKPSMEPLPVVDDRVPIDKSYFCDVCNRILVGQFQWNEHIKGKKHSFTLKKKLSEKAKEEKEESGKEASVTSVT